MKHSNISTGLHFIMAMVGGFGSAAIVTYVSGFEQRYNAPLFPFMKTVVENFPMGSGGITLCGFGIVLGFINPRRLALLSVGAVSAFPVITILEIVISPQSHNLWPVEFCFYAFWGVLVFIGSLVGRRIRGTLEKRQSGVSQKVL